LTRVPAANPEGSDRPAWSPPVEEMLSPSTRLQRGLQHEQRHGPRAQRLLLFIACCCSTDLTKSHTV
jgi:hypothetical protein